MAGACLDSIGADSYCDNCAGASLANVLVFSQTFTLFSAIKTPPEGGVMQKVKITGLSDRQRLEPALFRPLSARV